MLLVLISLVKNAPFRRLYFIRELLLNSIHGVGMLLHQDSKNKLDHLCSPSLPNSLGEAFLNILGCVKKSYNGSKRFIQEVVNEFMDFHLGLHLRLLSHSPSMNLQIRSRNTSMEMQYSPDSGKLFLLAS